MIHSLSTYYQISMTLASIFITISHILFSFMPTLYVKIHFINLAPHYVFIFLNVMLILLIVIHFMTLIFQYDILFVSETFVSRSLKLC